MNVPAPRPASWHFITGEYPPQPGGVSDYCAQVAGALAARGEQVHVWAPPAAASDPVGAVRVHRLPGRFDPASLRVMWRGIDGTVPPRRLFVQYVTGAWGFKALNFIFCASILRRKGDAVWVMFHEYAYPLGRNLKISHNVLGLLTPLMASLVARRADRIFVSTPAWEEKIPRSVRRRQRHPVRWLPIPANVAAAADPDRVRRIRADLAARGHTVVIGHFGTYGPLIAALLSKVLPPLLSPPGRAALLVGRGAEVYARRLAADHPALEGRLIAAGALPGAEVAAHLSACDVLVQPYEDGATSRRGSLMAGLALGLPVASNAGPRPETVFSDNAAVALAADAGAGLVREVEALIGSPSRRALLGERARALYESLFSLEHTVAVLLEAAASEDGSRVL